MGFNIGTVMVDIDSFVYYQTHLKILSKFIRLCHFHLNFINYLFIMCVFVHVCARAHTNAMKVRGQRVEVSFASNMRVSGIILRLSGLAASVSLSAAPSQPVLFCFKDVETETQRANAEKSEQ